MNRSELEHALRAAQAATGETVFIVLGSQSILGKMPDAPKALRRSQELDIYPRDNPDLSLEIEGSLGIGSHFYQTHGFCLDGCSPETAQLPEGWESRVTEICNENTNGAKGLCIHPSDTAYAKLYAGRPKDLEYVRILLKEKIVRPSEIEKFLKSEKNLSVRSKIELNFSIVGKKKRGNRP